MDILEGTQNLYCPLPLKIKQITQIELAFDRSYVFLQREGHSLCHLYHVSRHGKILFKN